MLAHVFDSRLVSAVRAATILTDAVDCRAGSLATDFKTFFIDAPIILSTFQADDIAFLCREGLLSTSSTLPEVTRGLESVVGHISRVGGLAPRFVREIMLLAKDIGRGEAFLLQIRRDESETMEEELV